MATKRKYITRIKLVDPTNLDEAARTAVARKYQISHKIKVEFIGEFEFEHQDKFSFEYASTLCNVGVVLYAKLHGYEIPDTLWTRGGVGRKLDALKVLVGEEGKQVEGKQVEGKQVEGKQVEGKPVEGKPVEGKPVEGKIVEPSKEDFTELLNDGEVSEEDAKEIQAIEGVQILENETKSDAPSETEEGNKRVKPLLQTKVIENPTEPKAELPKDLNCPHCGATARTEKSYIKNHGDNCSRKVDTK